MGAAVVRAYGIAERVRSRMGAAIDRQYRAEMRTAKYFAFMFPLGDVFGGLTLAAVVAIGVWWGPGWGLQSGTLIAFAFLVNLLLIPVAELGEILDQTQTAMAGWRKVLDLLDVPIDIVEAEPGVDLPQGSAELAVEGLEFALPRRWHRASRRRRHHPGRDQRGRRGRDRVGQDHLRQVVVSSGRPDPGTDPHRRHRPARRVGRLPVRRHPHGAPGRLPVRRLHRRERAHGSPRRHRRRGGLRVRPSGPGLVAGPAPRRSGHRGGRAGREPLGGGAPARRAWPGPSSPIPGC